MFHSTDRVSSGVEKYALPQRPRKLKPANPIETAVKSWFSTLPEELLGCIASAITIVDLSLTAPKRWVVYPPLVLLPAGSFSHESWYTLQDLISTEQKEDLWVRILQAITCREGKGLLTHLAINSGIPLHKNEKRRPSQDSRHDGSTIEDDLKEAKLSSHRTSNEENILRTPSGLVMLRGDFGPDLSPDVPPTEHNFAEAFWVSTKQNGITQIWAPRYTMFSRGNVKEKARLLNFHSSPDYESRKRTRKELGNDMAVDLYAGIGYFVFSYVKIGMKRVLGWELNPWSVEGLRRGAEANGWRVKIVKRGEEWDLGEEDVTIFEEDNQKALERLKQFDKDDLGPIRHVNCGLLPSSEGSYKTALDSLTENGWIHIHENVGVEDVEHKKEEIQDKLRQDIRQIWKVTQIQIEHVEFVKTFAPGVWHCVFDVYVTRS
ncbi:S-adenosyl-L-methionine-dependent methyltransferase [Tricladium varicosporioides]|nr:S-adenosyl-L-methionine-dependent methyltransferase [Hymenoscyphus varicosporioides]